MVVWTGLTVLDGFGKGSSELVQEIQAYRSVLEIIMKYLVKLFFEFNIWESQQELVTVRG